jgi:hypothetical protein
VVDHETSRASFVLLLEVTRFFAWQSRHGFDNSVPLRRGGAPLDAISAIEGGGKSQKAVASKLKT